MHQAGSWRDNGARSHKDCGTQWRHRCRERERENVMDDFQMVLYHLHSVVLWLKAFSQFHKLVTVVSPIAGESRGTGVEA